MILCRHNCKSRREKPSVSGVIFPWHWIVVLKGYLTIEAVRLLEVIKTFILNINSATNGQDTARMAAWRRVEGVESRPSGVYPCKSVSNPYSEHQREEKQTYESIGNMFCFLGRRCQCWKWSEWIVIPFEVAATVLWKKLKNILGMKTLLPSPNLKGAGD